MISRPLAVPMILGVLTWGVACAPGPEQPQTVVNEFFAARDARDEQALTALMAPDVTLRVTVTELHGRDNVVQTLLDDHLTWDAWNIRTVGDTVVWIERKTVDTPRAAGMPPMVVETEMQAVVLDGRIQSLSPTSQPLRPPTRADGAGTQVITPSTFPPLWALGLSILALATGTVLLRLRWSATHRVAKPVRPHGHLLAQLRRPPTVRPEPPRGA